MYDINKIRSYFPMLNNVEMDGYPLVYLDSGATALKPNCVIDKVVEYYSEYTTNTHRGDYSLAHKTDSEFEQVRYIVKDFINANSNLEIAFIHGATHGLNVIANGLGQKLKKGDVVLISHLEHAANVLPWFKLKEEIGIEIEYVELDENYELTVESFKKAMHDKVKVVSLAHISNVLSQVLEMKAITKIAHEYGALVVVDGAQSVPHIKVDVQDLDIDFLVFSAHKLCGPTGVGVLYGKFNLLNELPAYDLGGGMNVKIECNTCFRLKQAPYKFEAGTPPIEGVLGMGAAIKFLMEIGMDNIHNYLIELRKYAIKRIENELADYITVYNPYSESGPISFNVKGFEGAKAQDIGSALSARGIAVRTGEHCAKLLAQIINAKGSVRASLYLYNDKNDIDRLIDALKDIRKGDELDWLL